MSADAEREHMTVEDYRQMIESLRQDGEDMLGVASRMADECADRYGVRHEVPVMDCD